MSVILIVVAVGGALVAYLWVTDGLPSVVERAPFQAPMGLVPARRRGAGSPDESVGAADERGHVDIDAAVRAGVSAATANVRRLPVTGRCVALDTQLAWIAAVGIQPEFESRTADYINPEVLEGVARVLRERNSAPKQLGFTIAPTVLGDPDLPDGHARLVPEREAKGRAAEIAAQKEQRRTKAREATEAELAGVDRLVLKAGQALPADVPGVIVLQRGVSHVIGRGREASNGATLLLARVSKIHARVTWSADGPYLTDESSTNHTFVDGVELCPGESKRLVDGAEVSFAGEAVYVYHAARNAEAGTAL